MSNDDLTGLLHRYFPFSFQVSQESWTRFKVAKLLAHADPLSAENRRYTIRRLAEVYNRRPPGARYPVVPVFAEQMLCLGLINDALRYVLLHYVLNQRPGILNDGIDWVRHRLGEERVDRMPPTFARLFPPRRVLFESETVEGWLQAGEPRLSAAERVSAEAVLLYIMMRNPATRPFRELFDDDELQRQASYVPFIVGLEEFFDSQDPSDLTGQTLFHALRAPILASPDDLGGQLAYIRAYWAHILPADLLNELDLVQDLYKEMDLFRSPDYGPPPIMAFANADWLHHEPAAFSRDADWMSNVVLMAKSSYVWLDQLSRRYGRHLRTLADIPDEELDRLARWGFTGLWLIGVWERSAASRKIKQFAGNPDAVASAYSLHDYRIAADLGGEAAYRELRDRAWQRGIRLASDMVPNHMGIDSRWVIEHPQWFLQSNRPPYPAYRFTGGDLCDHPDVEIRIEEGYWRRDDAAVVFARRDVRSGEVRYIYHGNDGTSMPWNDTAQLDFTQAEVREAVIQTILHVARQFSIIRFDAAMTLAKKHYQRLWFPAPGDAGAIPSRAEYGLSRERFHELIPKEFWREVVDRIAAEVPQTLLLAEAFWLMEGYFVRTLGMHRVYNSAFMNMLKMEENQKYRQTVKNVLEFSPEILKRFVNFMNNPDERTAVEQFGKGDKYYGVAVLLVTMPGLPMFGHGQVEGFAEKYGMEYKRAYWDEPIDEGMVRRHEREIFPLMRRRALFSGSENFAFFDFVTPEGRVDENVFGYTNRFAEERALILYNNAYESTSGSIHTSTAINAASTDQEPYIVRRSLAEALALRCEGGVYYTFRDYVTGLEYLRSGEELARRGLQAALAGYQYQTFLDWREITDTDGRWRNLHNRLDGRPVPSLRRAQREMVLSDILEPLKSANDISSWRRILSAKNEDLAELAALWAKLLAKARRISSICSAEGRPEPDPKQLAAELYRVGEAVAEAVAEIVVESMPKSTGETNRAASDKSERTPVKKYFQNNKPGNAVQQVAFIPPNAAALYLAWQQHHLAAVLGEPIQLEPGSKSAPPTLGRFQLASDDLALYQESARHGLLAVLPSETQPSIVLAVADLLNRHCDLLNPRPRSAMQRLFSDRTAQSFLQTNCFDETWYFNKERLAVLLDAAATSLPVLAGITAEKARGAAENLRELAAAAGYRQQKMLDLLTIATSGPPPQSA